MRAAVVVVQREIEGEVEERAPGEGDQRGPFEPNRERAGQTPSEERVIDREDGLPLGRKVVLVEHDIWRHVQHVKRGCGHDIERQIRCSAAQNRGQCDPWRAWPRKGRGADDQVGRGIQPLAPGTLREIPGHDRAMDLAPDQFANIAGDAFAQFTLQLGPHDLGHDITQHVFVDLKVFADL